MKYFVKYGGIDSFIGNSCAVPYMAIVETKENAIKTINSWHKYGDEKKENLIVNLDCESVIDKLFSNNIVAPVTIYPTNGGNWSVTFCDTLGDTIEEHIETEKKKVRIAIEEKYKVIRHERSYKCKLYNKLACGFYFVSLNIPIKNVLGAKTAKICNYTIEADCKIAAINKALEQANAEIANCGSVAIELPNWYDIDVHFLGVLHNGEYSVEKWREENDKQSQG